jgi:hypothetical protein
MFTVYKTTNLITHKFYIGVHKTRNPGDNYLGSGSLLLQAVTKHGKENFRKEILHQFETPREAYNKEEELVAQESQNPSCYNMRKGGEGGFDFINTHGLSGAILGGQRAMAKINRRREEDPVFRERLRQLAIKQCVTNRENALTPIGKPGGVLPAQICETISRALSDAGQRKIWVFHPVTQEKRWILISEFTRHQVDGWERGTGKRRRKVSHSTYGKAWVSKDGKSEYINLNQLETFQSQGWKRGRVQPVGVIFIQKRN